MGYHKPDLVEGVRAHNRGLGLDGLRKSLLTQTILRVYDHKDQVRRSLL